MKRLTFFGFSQKAYPWTYHWMWLTNIIQFWVYRSWFFLVRFVLCSGPWMFFVQKVGRRDQVGEFLRRFGHLWSVGRLSKWMVSIRWCIRFTHSGFRSQEEPLQDTRDRMDARPTPDRGRRRRDAQGVLPLGKQYLQLEQRHQGSPVSWRILRVRTLEASSLSSALLFLCSFVTWPRWGVGIGREPVVNREMAAIAKRVRVGTESIYHFQGPPDTGCKV